MDLSINYQKYVYCWVPQIYSMNILPNFLSNFHSLVAVYGRSCEGDEGKEKERENHSNLYVL